MTQTKPSATSSLTGKWNPYPAYKDSGVEWVGQIPEHWEVKRLKFFAKVNMGQSPDSGDYNLDGIGIPFLQGNAEFGQIHPEPRLWCETARKFASVMDVLLSVRAPVGQMNISNQIYGIGRGLCAITVQRQMDRSYFWFFLQVIREELISVSTGSTYDAVSVDDVKRMTGFVPPLPEQRAIAIFLDREITKINALVAKKERMIELLQEKRTALISHAVTKGLDPAVPMKDSGVEWLGEIPAHWEVRRIKYLASILRGKFSHRPRNDPQMYDGPYPFLQTGDITATTKYITDYQQTLNDLGFAVSKQFPSGTLVMAIAANIGDLAILRFPACFPDSIVGFVPRPEVVLDYLFYNLTAMKQEMISTATINTQLNLNVERIGGLLTVCPPISEQHAIVYYLDHEIAKIDTLIAKIGEGIEMLKEYSTALVSAAVTGKIDVRGEITVQDEMRLQARGEHYNVKEEKSKDVTGGITT